MSYHQYYCDKCEKQFELNIGLVEGKYILFLPFTKEEEEKLWAEGKDPRFLEKEVRLKELPMSPPCSYCGSKKTWKIIPEFDGWMKGNCFANRERERKFHEHGMNKKQAENFYKESMQASKERISTMKEVYKEVVANPVELSKMGKARKLTDKESAQKRENAKKIGAELSKRLPNKKT
jgi:hypothetical protein